MRINSNNNLAFESRFEKYHPYGSGIRDAIIEAKRNLTNTKSIGDVSEANEFANAVDYLLNDGKDDIYMLKPKEDVNPYYCSDVQLYKNGELVYSFENSRAMDKERSYCNMVRKYVKDELKQDVSKNKTEGLSRLGDLEDVTDYTYGYNKCPESLKITREGYQRIRQSLDFTKTTLINLAAEEVYAKLDKLENEVENVGEKR